MMFSPTAIDRFNQKIHVPPEGTGCWEWRGTRNYAGYGVQQMDGRQWRVARVIYVLAFGPIPSGLQIDHLCFNRLCVNPGHLEAVTALVNMQRRHARKTHCAQGHPWIAENIYISKRGWRSCVVCNRTRWQSKLKGSNRSEVAKARWAAWTPEQRRAIGQKSAATRAKNAAEYLRIRAAA